MDSHKPAAAAAAPDPSSEKTKSKKRKKRKNQKTGSDSTLCLFSEKTTEDLIGGKGASPSLASMSPERPSMASGNTRSSRKSASSTSASLKSFSPERPDLSTHKDSLIGGKGASPSLSSMSPERPSMASGNTRHTRSSRKSASSTSASLKSFSPERPDLSTHKDSLIGGKGASPSLSSMSPERPSMASGNTRHTRSDRRSASTTSPSLQSFSPERPDLSTQKHRNVLEPFSCGKQATEDEDLAFPELMEEWTREHVRDWLITCLRISQKVAASLYGQETSGACLMSFEKQDLLELGVPPAPALQILRQVERFHRRSEPSAQHQDQDLERITEDREETQTVTTDSGFHSESASMQQEVRDVVEEPITENFREHLQVKSLSPVKRPVCALRPFDKSNAPVFYTHHHFLPAVAGPSNLLEPVHEYLLLPDPEEMSQKEVLFEFTNEMFCFAASCMNSRTNGTIHFGVTDEPGQEHGQIRGHKISSESLYSEVFESHVSKYFDQQHINTARSCIRPPVFVQVQCEDGTASDKWVIEVDVVPHYSLTQENVFYTILKIPSSQKHLQKSKIECLFVREGSRKVNILADSNPRVLQDKIKEIQEKVKCWASARRAAEEKPEPAVSSEHQGHRLKQLITRGQDSLTNSIQVFVVTDKCHKSQLEFMDFLKELNLFSVLDFDPESDTNGTCHLYRSDRAANLHFPHMYTSQDRTSVIAKLNLFKQTSWVFCNGRAGEESDSERPLSPSEWLKKRSGDINSMVSFLCSPDLLPKHRLLILLFIHSPVYDISSPVLETFCALYRSLEGMDNMLCICKDSEVFSQWKNLVEIRCKEDISNKCIYTLSLHEISSTIKKLKEPQTRATRRFLPSTGSSSVLLEKKEEEMMTDLEILCENECDKTEIETNTFFEEFKKNIEEEFYRGGQVSWWNFNLAEQRGSLPFIKRDKYDELHQLICPVQSYTSPCVVVSLFHHPGCGGTTLAKHILWSLKSKFRCAVVKNQMATTKEIALQVRTLLTYGKQDQPGYTPVLLLVDNWYDIGDLKQCIISGATDRNQPNMVVILNCERTQFPDEASRHCDHPNVFISAKLSSKEKDLFSEKYQELKDNHDKPDTFYAFMIMKNDFSKDYISDLVNNILKDLDVGSQQGRLLSFLALLNTYVNGSYMSLSLCEELMGIRNPLWRQETLEDKMNPYSTLLITFTVEEHGTYQAVRFLHQMIAENCIKVFKEHPLSISEITTDLLFCESVYKTCMGKDFLNQFIQSMLVTRTRREQGDDKNTLFSPLIEDIKTEEGFDKVTEVLERAVDRFDRSATLPQALARHMCLNEKDFGCALKWALDAQSKRSNSYIADTVGQVHKSQLKKLIEDSKEPSPESLDECLQVASKAVSAFKESQELAKKDELYDPFDQHFKRGHTSYNMSGYLGETEAIIMLLDFITEPSVYPASDRHKRDKLLQFLRGQHPVTSLYDDSVPGINEIVNVLKAHERFLVSLKPRLKENFTFYENYFVYLRPRHVPLKKETVDERNKRKISDLFKKYIMLFSVSEQEKQSERARNPKLSLQQVIVDHRRDLEMMQVDSFAGLLQSLSHKDLAEMQTIHDKWKFIFEYSGSRFRHTSDTVNYILANIVLHSAKPSSDQVKKYEGLVALLNDVLKREGTRSNLPELYYLCMLLMWPSRDQTLKHFTEYNNISTYITSAKRSFHKRFSFIFPSRSAIAHFFLGKSNGLGRIVSKAKLDQILQESKSTDQLKTLWHTGLVWGDPAVQEKLLRVKGRSENGDIYVTYGANIKIMIRPAYLGDIRSGYSREDVSFYIGFTLEGPVAYGVKYEN